MYSCKAAVVAVGLVAGGCAAASEAGVPGDDPSVEDCSDLEGPCAQSGVITTPDVHRV